MKKNKNIDTRFDIELPVDTGNIVTVHMHIIFKSDLAEASISVGNCEYEDYVVDIPYNQRGNYLSRKEVVDMVIRFIYNNDIVEYYIKEHMTPEKPKYIVKAENSITKVVSAEWRCNNYEEAFDHFIDYVSSYTSYMYEKNMTITLEKLNDDGTYKIYRKMEVKGEE